MKIAVAGTGGPFSGDGGPAVCRGRRNGQRLSGRSRLREPVPIATLHDGRFPLIMRISVIFRDI